MDRGETDSGDVGPSMYEVNLVEAADDAPLLLVTRDEEEAGPDGSVFCFLLTLLVDGLVAAVGLHTNLHALLIHLTQHRIHLCNPTTDVVPQHTFVTESDTAHTPLC